MSRASEWAESPGGPIVVRVPVAHPLGSARAMVERTGTMFLELECPPYGAIGHSIKAEDALRLAGWIIDTFGPGASGGAA